MADPVAEAREANASIVEAWNTVLFDKFCRFKHLVVEGLGQHGSRLFERFPPEPGARVLDVGCGFGDTTQQLAEMVGKDGEVVGVDCADNFIAAAKKNLAEHDVDNARFIVGDVQVDDLGGPYDAAYSRFGTMFFTSPVAALRNIRRSLRDGGFFGMSVWRKRQDNPCFYVAQQTVDQYIDEEDKDTDLVTCGPGPFSMAGADMVSDQLFAAGFTDPQFLRFDAPLCIGKDVDEALEFAREVGPAGESLRLAEEKASSLMPEIEQALKDALEPYVTDDGVWAVSSTWLVTARAG